MLKIFQANDSDSKQVRISPFSGDDELASCPTDGRNIEGYWTGLGL